MFENEEIMASAVKVLGNSAVDTNEKEFTATVQIQDTNVDVKKTLDSLSANNIKLQSMAIHQPTLDDVFLAVTGKQKQALEEEIE